MYITDMSRKYAANAIRQIRKDEGITMEELALRMSDNGQDITMATVHKLETGQMGLTLDYINAFAQALQVDSSSIIASNVVRSTRMVPILGTIAAGSWREPAVVASGHVAIPLDAAGSQAFALKPEGDSMDLLVSDNGFIVVDPDQVELWNDRCYAVCNQHGEMTFKRFKATPPRLEPVSSNPDHVPIPLGREPFTIIGRVTYVGSYV